MITAKELFTSIEQGITTFADSDRYKTFLKVMSKFSKYSCNNILLISMQMPNATLLAGANAWRTKFGRFVKKGEKGLSILAPVLKKHPNTKNEDDEPENPSEKKLMGFRVVHVFDVSQTEGKPLPHLTSELTSDVVDFNNLLDALREIAQIPVVYQSSLGGAYGMFSRTNNCIYIKEGLGQLQQIKTLIHEIAHSRLHSEDSTERDAAEVEAESVAYAVCAHIGLDTSDYSFGYLTSWSKGDTKILQQSFSRIYSATKQIISELEKRYASGK